MIEEQLKPINPSLTMMMEKKEDCVICGEHGVVVIINSDDGQVYFACEHHYGDVITRKLKKALDQDEKEATEERVDRLSELKKSSRKTTRRRKSEEPENNNGA